MPHEVFAGFPMNPNILALGDWNNDTFLDIFVASSTSTMLYL